MINIKQLKQQRFDLVKEARSITDAAEKESRDLNETESARFDAIDTECAALDKKIEREERLIQAEMRLKIAPPSQEASGIEQVRAEPVYKNIGEQMIDVQKAASPGGADPRAFERLMKVHAATGANESTPSEGGFLVQTDYGGVLSLNTMATGVLSSRCRKIAIGANSNGYRANLVDETSRANGSRFGGLQVYTAAEAATVTAKKPKFREIDMKLEKIMGLFYATDELLADATAMNATINAWFPQEFGFKIDDMIIRGTGAGQPLGILNSGALVTVAVETGQTSTDPVLFKNISKMDARLMDSSDSSAIWLINRDLKPHLAELSIPVGTGGIPIFLPANGAAGRPLNTLYGRDMVTLEQCESANTVGDILLVDLSEYLLIDKGGIEQAVSIHVMFLYAEQTFRFIYRMNGMPLRRSVLVPYKGAANTRSPFIALATRS